MDMKEWVAQVFGQADPSDKDAVLRLDGICAPDQTTLLRLVEVFENPVTHLEPYSDEVLDQAFWDLDGDVFLVVHDDAIDWALRHRLIRSFVTLFRELFAVRCTRILDHRNESGSALNLACYMWWDFDSWKPFPGRPTRDPFDSAFLAAMRSVLTIDHIACQEGALHGLGHWHSVRGIAVEAIIDEFLKNERHLDERLRRYGLAARRGGVQ